MRLPTLVVCVLLLAGPCAWAASSTWDPGQTPLTPSGGSGTWDATSNFWSSNNSDGTWTNSGTAVFAGSEGTVTLGGNISVEGIVFNTANYVLDPGEGPFVLTLTGGHTINASGAATIAASIAGTSGLIKTGAGTLALTGSSTFTGGLVINQGMVEVRTVNGLNENAVTLSSGFFQFTANQSIGPLNGTGGTVRSTVSAGVGSANLTINTNGLSTFAGFVSETGATRRTNLIIAGTGTQVFTGSTTYSGLTEIRGGTLQLGTATKTVPLTSSSTITVAATGASDAVFSGFSTVSGTLILGGSTATGSGASVLAAGSVGTLGTLVLNNGVTVNAVAQGATGSPAIRFELNSANLVSGQNNQGGTAGDFLSITGALTLGNGLADLLISDLNPGVTSLGENTVLTLATTTAGITGYFLYNDAALFDGSSFLLNSVTYQINYGTLDGHANKLTLLVVPEPGTLALLLGGAGLGLALRGRQRRP